MVTIAICDDEVRIGADLEHILLAVFDGLNIKCEIDVFLSGDEFIKRLEAGTHYDLIYLDIEFAKEEINGVEVGRLIRDVFQNNTTSIVYIAWEKKYAMQLFDIRPMNFLLKPLEFEKIEHTIKTYLKITELMAGDFVYNKGHDTFKVQLKDICWLENKGRKVIIHFADGTKEEFYGSLKEVYKEQLCKFDFMFIHASYVVNYDYVSAMKFNQLTLANNPTPLPISPNRRNAVREVFVAITKRRRL